MVFSNEKASCSPNADHDHFFFPNLERLRLHFSDWQENEREAHQDFFAKSRRLYHLTLSFDNGFHAADIPELLETVPASLTELTLDYSDAETFDIGAVLAALRGAAVFVPNLARLELIAPAGGHAFPYPLQSRCPLPTAAALTPRNCRLSAKYKPLIRLAGSASAEVFADIALRPLEMTKVKIQTSPSGTFLVVPYTMANFSIFEKTVELFHTHLLTAPKESYSLITQLGVTFGSGYIAGVVSAIVSNPADSLISQLGKAENKGKSASKIISEVGFANLATKGLGTRIFMLGTLTGFPWWIYDGFKAATGMGTTGGK
ncbi:hypothetical protein DFH09DRAFT_1507836 [Mycena vulgaris]|nr:hypothetical protein DFH09DRAFT_1507836 [Mycena vulgaris]